MRGDHFDFQSECVILVNHRRQGNSFYPLRSRILGQTRIEVSIGFDIIVELKWGEKAYEIMQRIKVALIRAAS
jgi:hypothetical protein